MANFPCDSCISRKDGYVSCDSRYNCYALEKWADESSDELREVYGIQETTIMVWRELEEIARKIDRSILISSLAQEFKYSPTIVEVVYNLSREDRVFTRKVLELCTAHKRDPIEFVAQLITFEAKSKRDQEER